MKRLRSKIRWAIATWWIRRRIGLARWILPFEPDQVVIVDNCRDCGGVFPIDPSVPVCFCCSDDCDLRGV